MIHVALPEQIVAAHIHQLNTELAQQEDIYPGKRLYIEHFQSTERGRLRHTTGKESDSIHLLRETIYVNHARNLCMCMIEFICVLVRL